MTLAQITGVIQPATQFMIWPNLVGSLLTRFILFAMIAAGLFFLVRLITSGFSFLTSTGEPAKLSAATRQITNAVIGLVVVLSAFFIGQIIQAVFGLRFL